MGNTSKRQSGWQELSQRPSLCLRIQDNPSNRERLLGMTCNFLRGDAALVCSLAAPNPVGDLTEAQPQDYHLSCGPVRRQHA